MRNVLSDPIPDNTQIYRPTGPVHSYPFSCPHWKISFYTIVFWLFFLFTLTRWKRDEKVCCLRLTMRRVQCIQMVINTVQKEWLPYISKVFSLTLKCMSVVMCGKSESSERSLMLVFEVCRWRCYPLVLWFGDIKCSRPTSCRKPVSFFLFGWSKCSPFCHASCSKRTSIYLIVIVTSFITLQG